MAEIKRYQPDVVYARYGGGRDHVLHEHTNGDYVLHSDHLAAIKAAMEKEREECAKVVDAVTDEDWSYYRQGDISDRIRARGAAHD